MTELRKPWSQPIIYLNSGYLGLWPSHSHPSSFALHQGWQPSSAQRPDIRSNRYTAQAQSLPIRVEKLMPRHGLDDFMSQAGSGLWAIGCLSCLTCLLWG